MAGRQHAANKDALFAKSGASSGAKGAPAPPTTFTTSTRPVTTFTTNTHVGTRPDQPKRMDLHKLQEAEEYRSKASKALKTSVFGKWKPDYLNAGPYFERAAALYRAGGADEQAKEMFLKAAECNEHTSTFAAAAAAFKQAATIAKDSDEEEAAKLYAKEGDMWAIGGDTGRAADSLYKAAEAMEDTSPSAAVEYCLQACELLCPEGGDPLDLKRAPLASDVFIKSLNLALRNERAKEALVIANKGALTLKVQNLTSSLYKMYATQTILQLYVGDVVAADKTFMEDSGYIRAPECEAAENLLQAAKDMNADLLEVAIKNITKAYLDNNIIKMAKRLTLDRISGMINDEEEEEEEEEVGTPASVKAPVPPPRRGPTGNRPVDAKVDLQIDQDMELSEEEKAKLRAKPAYLTAPAPAPVVSRPKPASPPAPTSFSPPPSNNSAGGGLMDLSDLQADLDAAGGDDDDFDLDAAIAEAREQAGQTEPPPRAAPVNNTVSSPVAAPVSAPLPPQPPQPVGVPITTKAAPPVSAPLHLAPSKPPKRAPTETSAAPASSSSPAYDASRGPYSPGYDIAPPPAPSAKPPPPPQQQQQEDDDDDFLR